MPQLKKAKPLTLLTAALVAVGGWWFVSSALRPPQPAPSRPTIGSPKAPVTAGARPMLRPPDPSRRFIDFTPEQRVEFARKGHGPGG